MAHYPVRPQVSLSGVRKPDALSLTRLWVAVRLPSHRGVPSARRKERLWPHIREFADNGIAHTKRMLSALGENGTPCELYSVHGHYADAGEVR